MRRIIAAKFESPPVIMHTPHPPTDGNPPAGRHEPEPPGADLQNLAMLLAYDGSHFQGWQIQHHGPTVQGRLERALKTITGQEVRAYGSGRTDAGVHALNQVANFRLPAGRDLHKLRANLNGLVGTAISVKAIIPVQADFHARHRALGKHYRYQFFNRPYPPAFGRQRVWWIKLPLDLGAMSAAASHLIGEHDFSAFRAKQCEATHAVRTLQRLEVRPVDAAECTLHIDLEATAFLQHMARIITGTLVDVGLGKLAADAIPAILASRRREHASATAPAAGLHLVRVHYDEAAYPELKAFRAL